MNKNKYKNIILRFFSDKSIIPLRLIEEAKIIRDNSNDRYAFNRSMKNLIKSGDAELINSGRQNFIRLTSSGKSKLNNILVSGNGRLVNRNWDGFWRIIILDLPEDRKKERDALRYLLKIGGFACVKNTVWISPNPYEHLFANIKKDLELKNELIIIVTNNIDQETNLFFINIMKEAGDQL